MKQLSICTAWHTVAVLQPHTLFVPHIICTSISVITFVLTVKWRICCDLTCIRLEYANGLFNVGHHIFPFSTQKNTVKQKVERENPGVESSVTLI